MWKRMSGVFLALVTVLSLAGCAIAKPEPTLPVAGNVADAIVDDQPLRPLEPTAPPVTEPPVTEPPVTEPPVTEPPVTEPPVTEPPVTEPPVTEPPVTEPPVTEPPVTEPPVTEPPVTEPPVTEPPVTEPPVTEPPVTEPPVTEPPVTEPPATEPPSVSEGIGNEAAVLPDDAAIPNVTSPVASGILVKSNEDAVIDYSNTSDGYVMVLYTGHTDRRLKAQVKGPYTTYTFNLTPGVWAAFPLSDENGTYKVTVFRNVEGTKYATVLSLTMEVVMEDEFAPFLCSNQYVNIDEAPNTVAMASSLCQGADTLGKVARVYDYVVWNLRYDTVLASTVQSGYIPDLDAVLAKGSGICFDYAALMAGMLRSQGVPCKLVIGYAGDAYHAWINVWSESTGWVEGVVFFDGVSWKRMDPTFASSAQNSQDILEYIGNGANYSAKYIY